MKYRTTLATALCIISIITLSSVCFAQSIGDIKRNTADGLPISVQGSVTATFPSSIYIEQINRSAGIRVDTNLTFARDDIVNVSGTIQTDMASGERYIAPYPGYPQAIGSKFAIKPLGMSVRACVGGDAGYQQGITGEHGLNTIGSLVKVWGPISAFDDPVSPVSWFKINDPNGSEVKVVVPSGMKIDTDWMYVSVTGICSVEKINGSMTRVIKVRQAGDITSHQSWAGERLKTMTLDEKIGQMFQIRISGNTMDSAAQQAIQSQHVGGFIYFAANLYDPVRSANLSNTLQSTALAANGIPLLLSMDQEGGSITRISGGTDFPGNMAVGASRSYNTAFLTGSVIGSEVKAVGANMDLAPVMDVNDNPDNPVIGVRSFGEQPGVVSDMGHGYLDGLHNAGCIATAKHFPGHGNTSQDSHTGLPIVNYDFTTLDIIHGKPFRDAIANGMDCIMTAHIIVSCLDPTRPATLSPQVITGYLRDNLGFDGVCMTDAMEMDALAGYTNEQAVVMAIQAGVDLISLPLDLTSAIAAVKTAVTNGDIPQSRIDQAVARILQLKHKYGLFSNPYVNAGAASSIVGSADHKASELTVARSTITVVKNANNILPLHLTSNDKILLVTVQTTSDAPSRLNSYITSKFSNVQSMSIPYSPGSTTRNNVKTAASSSAITVIIVATADAKSYPNQVTLVNSLLSLGKPVICIGQGKPYELGYFTGVNAYLVTYSYKSCSFRAAADVLFGSVHPTGLLPVGIPNTSYGFGWGLTY